MKPVRGEMGARRAEFWVFSNKDFAKVLKSLESFKYTTWDEKSPVQPVFQGSGAVSQYGQFAVNGTRYASRFHVGDVWSPKKDEAVYYAVSATGTADQSFRASGIARRVGTSEYFFRSDWDQTVREKIKSSDYWPEDDGGFVVLFLLEYPTS